MIATSAREPRAQQHTPHRTAIARRERWRRRLEFFLAPSWSWTRRGGGAYTTIRYASQPATHPYYSHLDGTSAPKKATRLCARGTLQRETRRPQYIDERPRIIVERAIVVVVKQPPAHRGVEEATARAAAEAADLVPLLPSRCRAVDGQARASHRHPHPWSTPPTRLHPSVPCGSTTVRGAPLH